MSVEVIGNSGENFFTYFFLSPKVFYLTQSSVVNFRKECRIDQATTKVMDLMSYTKQFDIEMETNFKLAQEYRYLS